MTEQNPNAIATQAQQKIDSPTIQKAREFASRLKYMMVNGNKLEDKEIFALAHYAASNGLNPFAQEAYYLPGTGPITGIVGFRRKAQESLDDEVEIAIKRGFKFGGPQGFWVETRPATHEEAIFEDGDLAIHVTLRDSISNQRWRRSYLDMALELKELGESDYLKAAKEFVGNEPIWTGVGVVFASEIFAGVGKKEKFDRFERAAKRAEKIALKKRFPSLQGLDISGDENQEDMIDVQYTDITEQEQLPESVDTDAIINGMGFESEKPKEIRPYSPEKLKESIHIKIMISKIVDDASKEQIGLLASMLEKCFAGESKSADIRHSVTNYLVGYKSINDMPGGVVKVLLDWLDPKPDSGGDYTPNILAIKEANAVRLQSLKDAGQGDLFEAAADLGGVEK